MTYSRYRTTAAPAPLWREIAPSFADDRICLAGFLALETAEILAGIKPANLVNVVDRPQPCGRNLCRMWEAHGQELLEGTSLSAVCLCRRSTALLLLFYSEPALERLLSDRRVQALLTKAGYPRDLPPDRFLKQLSNRMGGERFPHEIGILLGYPLKDVAAFMGLAPLPFACQGPWKIFGRPEKSLELAARHRTIRNRMARRLAQGADPVRCLGRIA